MNREALARLRSRANLSAAELAAKAGVDDTTIRRIEAGQRGASSTLLRQVADALAEALKEDVGELLKALTDPA